MSIERNVFSSKERLAEALADAVAEDLNRGLDERGTASLAVSGGSTPALFLETLSRHDDIDWENVVITLVDERWVDEASERSNARLVRDKLLTGPASEARFIPLYAGGEVPGVDALARVDAVLTEVPRPFDAVILGMGNDGHTASFFPDADTLGEALSGAGPVVAVSAPGADEPRITLTLPVLLDTRSLYLHIEGEEKAQTLDRALETGPVETMPVRAVLAQGEKTVSLYWCP